MPMLNENRIKFKCKVYFFLGRRLNCLSFVFPENQFFRILRQIGLRPFYVDNNRKRNEIITGV